MALSVLRESRRPGCPSGSSWDRTLVTAGSFTSLNIDPSWFTNLRAFVF